MNHPGSALHSASQSSPLLNALVSDAVLEKAYRWLCTRRKNAKPNSDVWHLRAKWETVKLELQVKLRQGTYHFSPVRRYLIQGDTIDHWNAQDALVQKQQFPLKNHLIH